MASRRVDSENWPSQTHNGSPTKMGARKMAYTPRDEVVRLPQSLGRRALRPKPLNIPARAPPPSIKVHSPLPIRRKPVDVTCLDPQRLERAASSAPKTSIEQPPRRERDSGGLPEVESQYSRQQSDASFSMLDYYIGDATPVNSPELPPVVTVVDPAIERFDFGLPPIAVRSEPVPNRQEAGPATEVKDRRINIVTLPPASRSQDTPTRRYGLFPAIPEAVVRTTTIELQESPHIVPNGAPVSRTVNTTPSHQPPSSANRPRKPSLTGSSPRSRKDSLFSWRSSRRTPLRFPSDSTAPSGRSRSSTVTSASPLDSRSRWSDDTVTPPSTAATLGPRTSLESSPGRDSAQYPACFFEDDDDDDDDDRMPLKNRLFGKRSTNSSSSEQQQRVKSQMSESLEEQRPGLGKRLVRALLCGSCYHHHEDS